MELNRKSGFMRRLKEWHFGQGEFDSSATSFDPTAYPPSRLGWAEFPRTALWSLRQNPETWPRNESLFESVIQDGVTDLMRKLHMHTKLSTSSDGKAAIDFEGSRVIETFSQKPSMATASSGLDLMNSSLFQTGNTKFFWNIVASYSRPNLFGWDFRKLLED